MSLFDEAEKKEYNLVKQIIDEKKVDINYTNEDGETPLIVASQLGYLLVCKLLINSGADINSVDKYRQTSLHWASLKGHLSICELLISNGADVNYEDEYGRMPLHLASENNHFLVCKLLIRSGADVNHKNNDGETPIILTMNYKIIKLLIENGADTKINIDTDIADKHVLEDFIYKKAPEQLVRKNLEDFDLSPVDKSPVDKSYADKSYADKSYADKSYADKSYADEKSPRAVYDKLIHSGQITMLGSEFGPLFKIRIEHPDLYELFENYKNLSENPEIDCAFQVLFSLGLREVNISKRNSAVINKLSKYNKAVGINVDDLNEYLEQIFDLEKNSLLPIEYERFICNYFNVNLSDGQSTILLLRFDTYLHYVVVFKTDGMLFIFDPQKPIIFECQEIEDYYPNIIGFFVIQLNSTIENKPLIIEKCTLPIVALGGKRRTKRSMKRSVKRSVKQRKIRKTKRQKLFIKI